MSELKDKDKDAGKLSNMQVVAAAAKFLDELVEATNDATMPLQQVRLLLAIYINRELMQTDLPKHAGVAGASISRHIDQLGRNGPNWVKGERDEHNRKFNTVHITPEGRALIDGVARKVHRYFNRN